MLTERFTYQENRHKPYLLERLVLEQKLMDPTYQAEVQQNYILDRARIIFAVRPEIRRRLASRSSIRLLEIGGGKGRGVLAIRRKFPNANALDISMTSLTPLPDHAEAREQGIHVYTGVIAEGLPTNWTDNFDIVCTDSVLGWTDMPKAIAEIRRVLATGGVWFGVEGKDSWMLNKQTKLKEALQRVMNEFGMTNSMTPGMVSNYYLSHSGAFAVRYLKENT